MQDAAGADLGRHLRVGQVQRAGNDAVLFTLAFFTQIDQSEIGLAAKRDCVGGG